MVIAFSGRKTFRKISLKGKKNTQTQKTEKEKRIHSFVLIARQVKVISEYYTKINDVMVF